MLAKHCVAAVTARIVGGKDTFLERIDSIKNILIYMC